MTASSTCKGLSSRISNWLDAWAELVRPQAPLALAVSGGGDSLCLLHLASQWARARGVLLHVLTVDHGLRSESAGEAGYVRQLSQDLHWPCQILRWRRPVAGAHRARIGRHELLAAACRSLGTGHLLIGHTLDDQLETFLMRARQGSGWYGLGGMDRLSPSPAWPDGEALTLVRPLLAEPRAGLRDWLAGEGHRWIDDPTNEDRAYERVRARQMLMAAPELRARIAKSLNVLALLRRSENLAMADILDARVTCYPDASLDFDPRGVSQGRAVRVLGWLVQAVAGRATMAREAMLRNALQELATDQETSRTLSGAWLVARREGHLSLYRDPGAMGAEGELQDHFDGRFTRASLGQPLVARDHRARLGLPAAETGRWRSAIGPRLAHLCSLWRQAPKLSQVSCG